MTLRPNIKGWFVANHAEFISCHQVIEDHVYFATIATEVKPDFAAAISLDLM